MLSLSLHNDTDQERARVFIGSSGEGLHVAQELQVLLDRSCEVELWSQGLFEPGGFTLTSLTNAANRFDFAILVVTPDDTTTTRGALKNTVRDNVVFELGLFMGAIGPDRTVMVYDRKTPPNLPSDLAGVTPATFEAHSSGNLTAALGAAATTILRKVRELGPVTHRLAPSDAETSRAQQWKKRALKLLVDASEGVGAECVTGRALMSLLRITDWPHDFDGLLRMKDKRPDGGRILVALEYGPPFGDFAHEIDTVNGRFAEAADDFGAQAVLLVKPAELGNAARRRAEQFPAVLWLKIDEETSLSDLGRAIKEMLNEVRFSDYKDLTALTTPAPRHRGPSSTA